MSWATVFRAIGYYAVYPVVLVGPRVLSVLRVVSAPLVLVVIFLLHLCLQPLRILSNFESVYIFFGTATLIGIVAGCVLHFTLRYIYQLLDLDPSIQAEREARQLREQFEQEAEESMSRFEFGIPAVDHARPTDDIRQRYKAQEKDALKLEPSLDAQSFSLRSKVPAEGYRDELDT
ncbi:hypothetical protein VTO42DRAFT_2148 [Malbranchea cinnamomea]